MENYFYAQAIFKLLIDNPYFKTFVLKMVTTFPCSLIFRRLRILIFFHAYFLLQLIDAKINEKQAKKCNFASD